MASILSIDDLVAQLMALSPKDQAKAFSAVLLSAAGKAKGKKAKAVKAETAEKAEEDPDAPKKADNNYFKFTNTYVWPVLKAHADTLADEEDKKVLRSRRACMQISSALYAPIKALEASAQQAAMAAVTEASILETYATWKTDPPVPRYKSVKEPKAASAASVASAGSKAAASAASAKDKAEPIADADADAKRAAKAAIQQRSGWNECAT